MNTYSVTYLFVIFFGGFLIMISSKKNYKRIISSYSVIFALQQYFFLRTHFTIDVNRFYDNMNMIRNAKYLTGYEGVWFFLSNHYDYSTQPVAGIYLALCSLVQNNYFILFATGFIVSFNILTLMKLISIDFNMTKYEFCILFTLFFLSYDMFRAISGVRFALATTFFSLIFYKLETGRMRRRAFFIGSVFLSLIHTSIWLFFIIYLASTFFKHGIFKYILYTLSLMFATINSTLIELVAKLPIPLITDYFVSKNSRYYETDKYAAGFLVINSLMIILILIYFISYKYVNKTKYERVINKEYDVFMIVLLLLVIGSYKIVDLQNRTLILLNLLSFPYIAKLFKTNGSFFNDQKPVLQTILRIASLLVAVLFFILNSITLNNFF